MIDFQPPTFSISLPLFSCQVFLGHIQSTLPLFSPSYFPRPPSPHSLAELIIFGPFCIQQLFFAFNNCLHTPLCFPIMFLCNNFSLNKTESNDAYYFRRLKVAKIVHFFPNYLDPTIVFAFPAPLCFPIMFLCTNFLRSSVKKKTELRVMMLEAYCYRASKWAKVLLLPQSIPISPQSVAIKVLPLLDQNEQKFAPISCPLKKIYQMAKRKQNNVTGYLLLGLTPPN